MLIKEFGIWNKHLINGWSYDALAFQIKSKLHERQVLGDKSNNFYETLPKPQSDLAKDKSAIFT